MGIGHHAVEALIRENKYRPISGNVVLIGRQTVYFTPESILGLLEQHGVDVASINRADIKTGGRSIHNLPGFNNEELITDSELFRLLGVPKIMALDHSDYEGAEIIHDLTKPVPAGLESCADFILDGSTLDNVFDPAMAIRNFAAMLRPGGRLITVNMMSNHYEPYVILPPLWYFDYFVANRFADCKVYILVHNLEDANNPNSSQDIVSVFTLDIEALLDHPGRSVSAFSSQTIMATLVFAEKGPESTFNVMPSQQHYRSASDWESYKANIRSMDGKRPHLVRTNGAINFFDVRGGHLFIADDFTARDPGTEIIRQQRLAAAAAVPLPVRPFVPLARRVLQRVRRRLLSTK